MHIRTGGPIDSTRSNRTSQARRWCGAGEKERDLPCFAGPADRGESTLSLARCNYRLRWRCGTAGFQEGNALCAELEKEAPLHELASCSCCRGYRASVLYGGPARSQGSNQNLVGNECKAAAWVNEYVGAGQMQCRASACR